MKLLSTAIPLASLLILGLAGCQTAPKTEQGKMDLSADVTMAGAELKKQDPSLQSLFDTAYGYAVFPSVGKGAIGVGGAYGKGEVFEQGRLVGFCDMTQATIGLALGGQEYIEVIFFENKAALDRFKSGKLQFAAQASAVALKSGAAANAKYTNGVVVFTMAKGGLMVEASIGGQDFSYVPR